MNRPPLQFAGIPSPARTTARSCSRRRATKFARRHRGAVVAAGLIVLAILGGIAGTTIGMLRAQRARAEAEAVSAFLTDLLDSASPRQRKNETTVRELLHEAAGRISTELKDQSAARAQLLSTIGSSEFHLAISKAPNRCWRSAPPARSDRWSQQSDRRRSPQRSRPRA